jgi:ParB-like chromosome segregation protein Spo0J
MEKHAEVSAGRHSSKNQTNHFMQKLEHWSIDRLIEYARNPRKNDHAVDRVASVIHEFGFRVPILAKSDGSVIDGHLRLKAARKLKLEEVPVIVCDDMTETQIKAFRLSVNKVAELADWDDELLGLELADLRELDFDLNLLGFDADGIDAALNPPEPDFQPGTEEDQGQLDEKSPIECPHCHKHFVP